MLNRIPKKTLLGAGLSIALMASSTGIAVADEQPLASQISNYQHEKSISFTSSDSIHTLDSADEASVEELFTKYISLDDRNYMHVNVEEVRKSQYANNIADFENFALLMNELNNKSLGYSFRDGGSFAKCVVLDAIGVNMVGRLTNALYTAIRASKWPLAAKTILQIAASAGLNLGWKANAVGLAIALAKSAIQCRDEL